MRAVHYSKVQQFRIYSMYSTAMQNNPFSSNMNKITLHIVLFERQYFPHILKQDKLILVK